MKKHKNFNPKSEMDFIFVLDCNKCKYSKQKNLENKCKICSKLGNIPDVVKDLRPEIGSVL